MKLWQDNSEDQSQEKGNKNLWSSLGLGRKNPPYVIALVGSGGKTSLMGRLAEEGRARNLRVAVLTTTHIKKTPGYREIPCSMEKGTITVFSGKNDGSKAVYPGDDFYREICSQADLILVEADGSRMLPVKFPGDWEPVIPENVNMILTVCGMSGLGMPIARACHRWELAKERLKINIAGEEAVTKELMIRLLREGYRIPLRKKYPKAEFYCCLNQTDTEREYNAAREIQKEVGGKGMILSLKDETNILYTGKKRSIALIYMASGYGIRYGANKLLQLLQGKPLYAYGMWTLKEAAGRLREEYHIDTELIVVSRYPQILEAAEGIRAIPVYNDRSQEGITASIHQGMAAADARMRANGYLFAVADQPWLKCDSVVRLVERFLAGDKSMACLYDGASLGNPAVFSNSRWQELKNLTGDKGGSRILRQHPEDVLLIEADPQELRDIDFPKDAGIE